MSRAILHVILEVEEQRPGDALQIVDNLLDAGLLQDAINVHDGDAGPLHVEVAVVRELRQP